MAGAFDKFAPDAFAAYRQPELRAYTPTLRERITYGLNRMFFGDSREGQDKARVLTDALDLTPVGLAMGAYDVGREAASGNAGTAAVLAGLLAAPVPAKGLKKTIRAFHGSPHDFERFDMSKIGTGEGAQAYGHGLYFAENEGVARNYRDQLTSNVAATMRYKYPGGIDPAYISAAKDFLAHGYSKEDTLKGLKSVYKNPRDGELEAALNEVVTGPDYRGRMYEVEIDADPDQFLDWDKPLQGQPAWERLPEDVKRSIDEALENAGYNAMSDSPSAYKGSELHQALNRHDVNDALPAEIGDSSWYDGTTPKRHTAEYLKSLGVPGIKYLDQGSRGAGEGSRNFVLFRDDIIKILRKYGVASIAALPPAVQAAISQTYGVTAEDEPTTY